LRLQSQAMRRIQRTLRSSSLRISLTADWPGREGPTLHLAPTFTFLLTTYSHTQAGLRRQWKLWNEGFSPRHESSTQTGAYKAVEGKRRGSESNLLGPEPASRESRSYRDNSGNEYDYWYDRF
jgi:hypothetical protein